MPEYGRRYGRREQRKILRLGLSDIREEARRALQEFGLLPDEEKLERYFEENEERLVKLLSRVIVKASRSAARELEDEIPEIGRHIAVGTVKTIPHALRGVVEYFGKSMTERRADPMGQLYLKSMISSIPPQEIGKYLTSRQLRALYAAAGYKAKAREKRGSSRGTRN